MGQQPAALPDRIPDSIKVFVRDGRMVQVTGSEIAECIANANVTEEPEEVEGAEVFTLGGAADGRGRETPDTGAIVGTWDTTVTAVPSKAETGFEAAGSYCLKIATPQTDRSNDSGFFHPSARFVLRANTRYRISCRVFCREQRNQFVLAVVGEDRFLSSPHSGQLWALDVDNSGEYFRNTPGEWTQFTGIITTPDEGDRECQLYIHHDGVVPLTWYLDDISLVPLQETTQQVEYRAKTPEEAALSLATLNANRVNLYNGGSTVPIQIDNVAADGSFLPESIITFWGDPPSSRDGGKNLFTRENTYVLHFGSSDPLRRYHLQGDTPPQERTAEVRSYKRTLRLEEDNHLQYYQQYKGMPTDRVMWATFKAPPRNSKTVTLPAIADLSKDTPHVEARVYLWGGSDLPQDPDHRWDLSLNKAELGTATWDGYHHQIVTGEIAPAYVKSNQPNTLTFIESNSDSRVDVISLDYVEFAYRARLLPQEDFLEFSLDASDTARIVRTEPGFSGPDLRVFFHGQNEEVRPETKAEGRGYATAFTLPPDADRCRVVGAKGFTHAARLSVGYRSHLRNWDRSPQYLIIADATFLEALRPLIAHRVEQGLDTRVVDVDEIYDEYSDGVFDPVAVRLFLDDLLGDREGDRPRLQYVWLVGDATYDYMGIRPGSRNYVPTHHSTEATILPNYAPTFAQDDYFAFGTEGGAVPLAAIGRLPANRIETVTAYVEKVLEYERHAAPPEPWRKRAVLISSKDFNWFSHDTAENILKGWSTVELTGTGDAGGDIQLRHTIVDTIDAGCGVVTFTGHGAYYVWRTGENMNDQRTDMMTDRDIARLTNRGKYPIVFTATCFSALYDAPIHGMSRVDSGVGIYFVQAPGKGAIALIGHVGKVDVADAHRFNRFILNELANGSGPRLGDLFLAAKAAFPQDRYSGIALIGDPALVVTAR